SDLVGRQGEVVDASAKARSILKLAPELLLGTGLFDRVHLSDRVAYLTALADMREDAPKRGLELRIRLPREGSGAADNFRPFSLELMRGEADRDLFTLILRENDAVAALREELAEA
ncbi:PAS domain-containing sensor histidine kinase, partial [bacterium M00.F.Ca.ET.141.01.1.1]